VPISGYYDTFGNWCSRIVASAGRVRLTTTATVEDSGEVDIVVPDAKQHAVPDLPEDTLLYLLGSCYCETDKTLEKFTVWTDEVEVTEPAFDP
jgi:hypothetical protein